MQVQQNIHMTLKRHSPPLEGRRGIRKFMNLKRTPFRPQNLQVAQKSLLTIGQILYQTSSFLNELSRSIKRLLLSQMKVQSMRQASNNKMLSCCERSKSFSISQLFTNTILKQFVKTQEFRCQSTEKLRAQIAMMCQY